MNTFVRLVEEAKKEARKNNLIQVRKEIDHAWVQEKIQNFIERWDYQFTSNEVVEQILNNDIIAAQFSKDPTKQNISEKMCASYLNWKLLPQQGKNAIRFTSEGEIITTKIKGCSKCADFYINEHYITQKYTGKNTGGAQDNQMDDVILFLTNASKKYKCGACVDGWYWDENGNRAKLKEMFKNNPNVIIFSVEDIKNGVISLA